MSSHLKSPTDINNPTLPQSQIIQSFTNECMGTGFRNFFIIMIYITIISSNVHKCHAFLHFTAL